MRRVEPQEQAEGFLAGAALRPRDRPVGQQVVDIGVAVDVGGRLAARRTFRDGRIEIVGLSPEAEIVVPGMVQQGA